MLRLLNIFYEKEKNIYINKKNVGRFYFSSEDPYVKKIKEDIVSIFSDLLSFYSLKSFPCFSLDLIYSRKDFNEIIGRETQDWLVSFVRESKIFLFSSLVMEKETSHKKEEVNKILIHELCHIFNNELNKNILQWVDEGIALYLAGQKKKKPEKNEWKFFENNYFTKNISLQEFAENGGYKVSYWAIKTIADLGGKKEILKYAFLEKGDENEIEKKTGIFISDSFRQFSF